MPFWVVFLAILSLPAQISCKRSTKPGFCPVIVVDVPGNCLGDCKTDRDCSYFFKCCKNACESFSCAHPEVSFGIFASPVCLLRFFRISRNTDATFVRKELKFYFLHLCTKITRYCFASLADRPLERICDFYVHYAIIRVLQVEVVVDEPRHAIGQHPEVAFSVDLREKS